jgi:type II pantothenate kinase
MPPFPLIADPASYRANTIDMVGSEYHRNYWIDVFDRHTTGLVRRAIETQPHHPDAPDRAAEFARRFRSTLADLRADPLAHGPLSICLFCTLRQHHLIACGFDDPYRLVKHQENELALSLLPNLLRDLDAISDPSARLIEHIRGIFAGNIFDLGASKTIELYEAGKLDFHATVRDLPPRPWLADDFDALCAELSTDPLRKPHRKAVMFVDNAGADVTLGMIPFARLLLQRGSSVVLTANTLPALNDITFDELNILLARIASFDAVLRDALSAGRLTTVPSGNGLPVIDLMHVSDELAAASHDADLLVLEGMGRAIETNWHARFTVPTLKLAMVKEQDVADVLGGKLYDVVCRFDAPAR